MVKKLFYVGLLIAMVSFYGAANASATSNVFFVETVDSSYVADDDFLYQVDMPYLHMHFPSDTQSFIAEWWTSPSSTMSDYFIVSLPQAAGDTYTSFKSLVFTDLNGINKNWSEIEEVGLWTMTATYWKGSAQISSSSEFRISAVPEPVSSVLFLLGGTGLVAFRRMRKN